MQVQRDYSSANSSLLNQTCAADSCWPPGSGPSSSGRKWDVARLVMPPARCSSLPSAVFPGSFPLFGLPVFLSLSSPEAARRFGCYSVAIGTASPPGSLVRCSSPALPSRSESGVAGHEPLKRSTPYGGTPVRVINCPALISWERLRRRAVPEPTRWPQWLC